jgi:hypothetical protein
LIRSKKNVISMLPDAENGEGKKKQSITNRFQVNIR